MPKMVKIIQCDVSRTVPSEKYWLNIQSTHLVSKSIDSFQWIVRSIRLYQNVRRFICWRWFVFKLSIQFKCFGRSCRLYQSSSSASEHSTEFSLSPSPSSYSFEHIVSHVCYFTVHRHRQNIIQVLNYIGPNRSWLWPQMEMCSNSIYIGFGLWIQLVNFPD